jgi:hypothetical protein
MIRSPFFDDLKLRDRFKTPGVTLTDEAIIEFSLKYHPQYFSPGSFATPYVCVR